MHKEEAILYTTPNEDFFRILRWI